MYLCREGKESIESIKSGEKGFNLSFIVSMFLSVEIIYDNNF